MANLRFSDGMPNRFYGKKDEDPQAHWHQFNDYATLQNLNQAHTLARFKMTLGGEARLWIDGKNFQTVDALRQAFTTKFSGLESREARTGCLENCQVQWWIYGRLCDKNSAVGRQIGL